MQIFLFYDSSGVAQCYYVLPFQGPWLFFAFFIGRCPMLLRATLSGSVYCD
jgi:hypothetical protein